MKLGTYSTETTQPRACLLIGDGIVDIETAGGGALPSELGAVLAVDDWKAKLDALVATAPEPSHALDAVHICAPIAHPGKILAAAGNYQAHVDEGGGVRVDTARRTPRVFSKPSTTLVGPYDPVVLPAISDEIDWELELALVIGRDAKEVSVDSALDYVAGYSVFNDVSARSMKWGIDDREVHDWDKFFDWLSGKWVDSFAPMGPWIVTTDEIPDPHALHLQLELNGEVRQSDSTAAMIFDCRDLIAHCSRFTTLRPGDVIATGTPSGVGVASGRFLAAGDVMVGTVEGLGTQRTPVVAVVTDAPRGSTAAHPAAAVDVAPIQHVDEFEALARKVLSDATYGYVAGGAGLEATIRRNRDALDEILLVPKVLRGVDEIAMHTSVFGAPASLPLLVAPSAMQQLAHPEGEVATAAAAAAFGVPMVLSMNSSIAVEEVASTGVDLMMQLYVSPDRSPVEEVIARAEAAGARALFLTVDHAGMPVRLRELRSPLVIPEGIEFAHLSRDPARRGVDRTLDWTDVAWLRSTSTLPIVLKGVLHPEDARRAVDHGVDGIVVSNHGGRQLDGVVSPYDVIDRILEATAGQTTVLADGGVRSGSDLVKVLALGADAALVGRPIWWSLAAAGRAGVARVLDLLGRDFEAAMRLCGMASPTDATLDLLHRKAGR